MVGVAAEGIFALQFQQGADLVEDGRDFVLVHVRVTALGLGWKTTRSINRAETHGKPGSEEKK